VSVVKPDPRDGSAAAAPPNVALTEEAIAWYQVAAGLFTEHRVTRQQAR
jgi:hypothetical protein